ncbi:6136_t:CDS:1 [Racocetra persica]|uniref:6136_t:CDS:1 n=1 Tax=Racocetra persica TaxID=160502 RepID=A0ACA9SAV9_9GLOM|nr:6136_t:CDS:1 [Racocetra persica]
MVKKKELVQYDALSIAKYLLSLDKKREYFVTGKMPKISGIAIPTIGNFRLNKLLHISQILYCAKEGKYLFTDPLMAFEHGGVVYEIYRQFHFLVKQPDDKVSHLTPSIKSFLDKIFHYFYKYRNEELEKFTHSDPA